MDIVSHKIVSDSNSEIISTGTTGSDISSNNVTDTISMQDALLNDSRITPGGNGNLESKPYCTQPTSGQKWWAAVLLGFVFALVSSPAAYSITSAITTSTLGLSLIDNTTNIQGVQRFYLPNFIGLLIHTLIFIVIVRIILW